MTQVRGYAEAEQNKEEQNQSEKQRNRDKPEDRIRRRVGWSEDTADVNQDETNSRQVTSNRARITASFVNGPMK
ncbi:hypothetical protein BLNAU_13539 [Blattamonas nauphoetae]|uniref:Uncharacterized protein n=1 Tax=Blattamonas nauphoetae TaxID=2049346 RepID=A0ABQ9XGC6_9EUKA|nr:hypothetical protein BLNAU_13539 [Blattamonas nauphoetae]